MFLFGGLNENDQQTDDFFWITPDFKYNNKLIDKKTGEYKGT